jgi:integrase/recombinase XerD
MTVLRWLFSYLQTYGYAGASPAQSDFVEAPAAPRDGETGLTRENCRGGVDAPDAAICVGTRDRALLGVLAYSACRVEELAHVRVCDYKFSAGHLLLEIFGNGGKDRRTLLHAETVERIETWPDAAGIREEMDGCLFRAAIPAPPPGWIPQESTHATGDSVARPQVRPRALARSRGHGPLAGRSTPPA